MLEGLIFLLPGIHPNLLLPYIKDPAIAISLYISSLFFSLIPSALFLIPSSSSHINLLPLHKKVKAGKAFDILSTQAEYVFIAILLSIFLSPIVLFYLPAIKSLLPYIIVLLLLITTFSFFKNLKSIAIFLFSSALGLSSYNFLLPMLTGFFGLSTLLLSKGEDDKQIIRRESYASLKKIFPSVFYASFFSLIPCISSTIFLSLKKSDEEDYIFLVPAISSSYVIFSIFALYSFDVKRSGIATYLSLFNPSLLPVISIIVFVSSLSFLLFKMLLPFIIKAYQRVNKKYIKWGSVAFIIGLNALFGLPYLVTLFLSTLIGLLCQKWRVKRIVCMGSLITPTLMFYLNQI